MSDFGDVFDEASRDIEAEQRTAALAMASVDAQEVWPFLALAQSTEEFGHRLALAEPSLTTIAQRHGVSYEDVTGPLERGFTALHGAKEAVGQDRLGDLRAIQREDPDGKSAGPPTPADYAAHESWAKERFGEATWKHYIEGGWDNNHHSSLQTEAKVECKNCQHANGTHAKGAACPDCGCDSYQPRTAALQTEAAGYEKGSNYDVDSVHDLPLGGSTSSPERFYDEGYEHAVTGADRKGYGSRDKSMAYGHGYSHGQKDKGSVKRPARKSSLQTQATDPGSKGGPSGEKDHHSPGFTGHDSGEQDNSNDWGVPGQETTAYGHEADPYRSTASQRLAGLHQALMEGQDPLTWVQQQNPPGGPQNALVPSYHAETQSFDGQPGTNAYRDAMEGGSGMGMAETPGGHTDRQASRHPFA